MTSAEEFKEIGSSDQGIIWCVLSKVRIYRGGRSVLNYDVCRIITTLHDEIMIIAMILTAMAIMTIMILINNDDDNRDNDSSDNDDN